jgi:hypothetical protein
MVRSSENREGLGQDMLLGWQGLSGPDLRME